MANLVINISGETKEFEAAIEEIKSKTSDLEGALGGIAAASSLAFAGIVAGAGVAVHAYAESEKASKELVLALENQGIASQKLIDDYKALATAIQNKTGVDDDAIISGEAVLQTFIGQTKITKELAQAMVDLSIKTGSLESAATILGKGIEGNVKGLKKFGIIIDDTLPKNERMQKIIEGVTQKFGGLAEVNNQGLGAFKGLSTAFGNFLEGIGERMAPTITKVVVSLTNFFTKLADNQALLDFIFEAGKIAAIATGTIAALSTTALTIIKVQQAFQIAQAAVTAFGLASKVAVGATGLGLLLVIGAEVYANWNKIFPVLQAVYNNFVQNITRLTGALKEIMDGVGSLNPAKIKEGFDEATTIIAEGFTNIHVLREQDIEASVEQDQRKLEMARASAEAEKSLEMDKMAVKKAMAELQLLKEQQVSNDLIALKKTEVETLNHLVTNRDERQNQSLKTALAANRAAQAEELARIDEFRKEILDKDKDFQKLSQKEKEAYLKQNQAILLADYKSRNQAIQEVNNAASTEELQKRIEAHNKFLIEQQKFGTAYAAINFGLGSEEVKNSSMVFGKLSALQSSKNKELKAIGKAAAIADITIKTAQSAMAIFAGFASIPIVGVPLGIAGAAAAVAFGAEQISQIVAAEEGGMITGGVPGVDSVPVLAMPGELVVPKQNFEEVVSAVSTRRQGEAAGTSTGFAEIVISLKGDLMDFIETKLVERERLQISIQGAT